MFLMCIACSMLHLYPFGGYTISTRNGIIKKSYSFSAAFCILHGISCLWFAWLIQLVGGSSRRRRFLSEQAVQTKEILLKRAVKIAKQAEQHERILFKVFDGRSWIWCILLDIGGTLQEMMWRWRKRKRVYPLILKVRKHKIRGNAG
uniref:Uncharacterized protein LOC105047698 isoform X1 n=1 Tax=Elaeis guineensis var. tenera TaxID=51953 RepID=A0A6J0PJF8_ELAGV|nr:uncharacterized protein LOC105047698 isoform X1 [Elaeis guineensis]